MPESLQHKLDRVRSPRVHITYDVETGGAIEKKELPFVMGVFGDFTGQPEEPLPRLKDRKFVEVNPDNFDSVLAAMKPHLSFQVENKISDDPDAGQVKVDLHFRSMEDFEPTQVARQIKPLNELLDLRTQACRTCAAACRATTSWTICCSPPCATRDKLDKLKSEIGKGEEQMSNEAKKAAQPPRRRPRPAEASLLDQIVEEGRLARDPETRSRGKDLVKEFVSPVPGREHDALARFRGDDQRPHRADRPPDFAAAERGAASPGVSEAGSQLARAEVPV